MRPTRAIIRLTLALALGVTGLSTVSCGATYAETAVVAPDPPPAPRDEVIPEQPGARYAWIPGRWEWRAKPKRYVWVPGRWQRILHAHHRHWVPGEWQATRDGYRWEPGHWR